MLEIRIGSVGAIERILGLFERWLNRAGKSVSTKLIVGIICLLALLALSAAASEPKTVNYNNPVIPGDYPDPSIIRVGHDYWAAATSGGWEPAFPLLHSRDLVNWQAVGAVFQTRPSWAGGDFWAPEISEYKGKFFVYYTARKVRGPLCVAVAVADAPRGPYVDQGPLVCQDAGSIDAFAAVDENGERYLIWKEDGNSRDLPTPIWAQHLSKDGTHLLGEKTELIRNDKPWEGKVVEGPFILRRGGYFYLFYSGAGCCGLQCDYALGVARSKKLLGPWEKNPLNPIVASNEKWKCPGHGSIVTDPSGRNFFLFHSYESGSSFFRGRQGVLQEVTWNDDGWPSMNCGRGVSVAATSPFGKPQTSFKQVLDEFKGHQLAAEWQWPAGHKPLIQTATRDGSGLILGASDTESSGPFDAILTRRVQSANYVASTAVRVQSDRQARSGLLVFGTRRSAVGVAVSADGIVLCDTRRGASSDLRLVKRKWNVVHIRVISTGDLFKFEISPDSKSWETLGEASGLFEAPWDGSVRLALFAGGARNAKAEFQFFGLSQDVTSSLPTKGSGQH
jgi:beta-xylosidase